MTEVHCVLEPVALLLAFLDPLKEKMLCSLLCVSELRSYVRTRPLSDSRLQGQLLDSSLGLLNSDCFDF